MSMLHPLRIKTPLQLINLGSLNASSLHMSTKNLFSAIPEFNSMFGNIDDEIICDSSFEPVLDSNQDLGKSPERLRRMYTNEHLPPDEEEEFYSPV